MNDKNTNQDSRKFEELLVKDIIPTRDNPRTININSAANIELTANIKAQGVIVPVHIRIHPKQSGKFELLAGERRLKCSVTAGRVLIPAINYGKINDEKAFDVTFTENFGREDLTPLEEGKAAVTLLEKYKGDVAAVASKIGKSIKWVRQRQALGTKLTEAWQKAFNEADNDNNLKHWTASHLQCIAALPRPMQEEILKDYEWGDLPTLKEIKGHIADMLQLLNKAPFDIEKSGCTKCQKRTSCQPGLYDDSLDPQVLKKNDRCLDRCCWVKNTLAWLKTEFEAKKEELPALVAIATESPEYDSPVPDVWPDYLHSYNFNTASKKAKGAVPGFIVSGKAIGTVLWIKLRGSQTGSNARKSSGKPTPLAERRKMLHNKRMARFLEDMYSAIADKKVSDLVAPDKTTMVMSLAHVFGVKESYEHSTFAYSGDNQILTVWEDHKKLVAADLKTIRETLWWNVLPKLLQSLVYAGPITQTPKHRITAAQKLAGLFGIGYKAMQKKTEEDFPEPKSWAKLNANGTPKSAKKKAAKKKTAKKKKAAGKQKKGDKENAKS